jgi:uncharacterized membrane protein YgdD (TMEM256/DUF423 family)
MSPALLAASLLGALGVALGAFGAHGLRARVSVERLAVLALLGVAIWWRLAPGTPGLMLAGWGFTLGILIFSGSLYALVLSDLRWLGAITPLGGLLLIAGWLGLAWAAFRLQPA